MAAVSTKRTLADCSSHAQAVARLRNIGFVAIAEAVGAKRTKSLQKRTCTNAAPADDRDCPQGPANLPVAQQLPSIATILPRRAGSFRAARRTVLRVGRSLPGFSGTARVAHPPSPTGPFSTAAPPNRSSVAPFSGFCPRRVIAAVSRGVTHRSGRLIAANGVNRAYKQADAYLK